MMRAIFSTCCAFGIGSAAFILGGCGQGPAGSEVSTSDNGTDQALTAVDTCQDQMHACVTDGGGQACEDQLRACLMAILPSGQPDAGDHAPSSPPGLADGGPAHPDNGDGGVAHGANDGGTPARPPLPDAAVAALTNPVGNDKDGGSATLACVDVLRSCLATASRPDTCATSFKSCLQGDGGAGHRDAGPTH